MNWIKTFLLMGAITALFIGVGYMRGGPNGAAIAFVLAAIMNLGSYWFSDKIVLSMYGAQELDESQAPNLFSIVRGLTTKAGLPMPKVYMIPNDQPNAFATGRNPSHAAVAVTDGIMRLLNDDELEGVLGHELAHVQHRDILIGTIAATLAGAIMMLRYFGIFFGGGNRSERDNGGALGALIAFIVAPLAAVLIQMAISRSREYAADQGGAQISGKPWALASALRKLQMGAERVPMAASEATAHMFIVNPFSAKGAMNLFSTHPPTEERIKRLEQMH